jgi:hypothetical protein
MGATGATGEIGPTGATGTPGTNGISAGLVLFFDIGATTPQTSPVTNGTLNVDPIFGTQVLQTHTSNGSDPDFLMTTLTTPVGALTSQFIVAGSWDMSLYAVNSAGTGGGISYYFNIYEVASDGITRLGTIGTGTSATACPIFAQNIYTYSLFVQAYTLASTSSRIQIEIRANFTSGNKTLTIEYRDNSISHVHTTLVSNPGVGATGASGASGATGLTGNVGATGQTGPTLAPSWLSGGQFSNPNVTFANQTNTLITSQSVTSSSASAKLLIMGSFTATSAASALFYFTFGRTAGATGTPPQSNTVNLSDRSSNLSVNIAGNGLSMWRAQSSSSSFTAYASVVDTPGPGNYTYSAWGRTAAASGITDTTAELSNLTILQVLM